MSFAWLPEESGKGNSSAPSRSPTRSRHTRKKATSPGGLGGSHLWLWLPSHLLSVSFTNVLQSHQTHRRSSCMLTRGLCSCWSCSRNATLSPQPPSPVCFRMLLSEALLNLFFKKSPSPPPINVSELPPSFISPLALITGPCHTGTPE